MKCQEWARRSTEKSHLQKRGGKERGEKTTSISYNADGCVRQFLMISSCYFLIVWPKPEDKQFLSNNFIISYISNFILVFLSSGSSAGWFNLLFLKRKSTGTTAYTDNLDLKKQLFSWIVEKAMFFPQYQI